MEIYSIQMPALLVADQRIVNALGASVTPEAVALSSGGEALYRGRIDDRYAGYGKRRVEPMQRDLRNAIDDILADRPFRVPKTKPIGCIIR